MAESWSTADREALASAIQRHGHTQAECAVRLRDFGIRPDQSSVSKWIHDPTRRPQARTIAALRRYIADAPAGDAESPAVAQQDDISGRFSEAVAALTEEPLLGPRQSALVDALTKRLRSGPPMNRFDQETRRELMALLRLSEG